MEGGLPMLNCLLQHTLRSLCACSDSSTTPSKWVYAVFWRILPRNYPPPKWDHGGGLLDRAKGNKRNWILVWEDGFCDFCECEGAGNGYVKGRFGADLFFKMTHEVYSFGEGLVGKVASDNSHKWVFRDSPTENDPAFMSSWNVSIDPQPRAWEAQFSSGIEVIEDLNLVLSIQRKFSYIQSIPGIYAIQRPYLPIQNPNNFDHNNLMQTNGASSGFDDKQYMIGLKRQNYEKSDESSTKSTYLGYNSPQSGIPGALPLWSIPPLLPCDLGSFFSKIPSVPVPYYAPEIIDHENALLNCTDHEYRATFDEITALDVKVQTTPRVREEGVEEEKPRPLNQ
ncbi:protein RICE SALT SENSITIVE 3 [Sesamum alatum]|uniref:Protein RICE SALT SENSITIVE 3 n=1 Tax=Sesamum alatum TaxID=300844 RepID=A0AAE1YQB0_9LAMI|nr:protein RICE SALT SENSITIVE 3 [Sesamum alatum]